MESIPGLGNLGIWYAVHPWTREALGSGMQSIPGLGKLGIWYAVHSWAREALGSGMQSIPGLEKPWDLVCSPSLG